MVARFFASLAIVWVVFAACEHNPAGLDAPGPLATITVLPNPDTLMVGTTRQFVAVGKDARGNVVEVVPTWMVAAEGGTVGAGGLFTAGTVPGTYVNTVRASFAGISGFATVTVTVGPLSTITVTPDPADLVINATQSFTATGHDAFGNVVAITPTWSVAAGGGAIDAGSGLFTAGTVPGTYAQTVVATSGTISGSATVNVTTGPLATITVTPDPATLGMGANQLFTAVGRDAGGNVLAITPTWSVVAGGGAIHASSGLFTAGTLPGTYAQTVKATSGGISGLATVIVSGGALATITVTPDPANLGINGAQQFTATGKDAFGNVVAITPEWSVVAGGGAIDTGSGLFTAGPVTGTYPNTVKAFSGGISGFATVNVSAGALATITVTPDPADLGVGASQQFTAVGRDASGNVVAITPTWSVVASGGAIDAGSGLFTAGTAPGTYANTVQASSGGISGFATVTVSEGALASITVTPDPANLGVGATQLFTATGRDAFGNVVAFTPAWSSVAGGGAIDGSSGLFTAGTVPGTYTNTVKVTSGGISGFATVTVNAGALASITITPTPVSLATTTSQQFTATGRDAFGNVVAITPTWSTVAGGGATNETGLFTAGTVTGTYANTVVATSGGISGSATVTVVAGSLATITVTPDPANLVIGAAQQFTAVGRDASGNPVAITPVWSTVAGGGTIGAASGLFTAGSVPGTFTHTVAATSGGVSGFATVTVVAGPLATITVSPDTSDLGIGATQTFTAVGKDAAGNVVVIEPTWSVVAGGGTIDAGSGLFTAGNLPGTYGNTVQATSGGISGSATVTVHVGALASITVTPDPASLAVGATQQFTATGRDAFGNVVAITPVWSAVAGGGTIGAGSGLFTAGTVPGTYTHTVKASSGGVSGFATVTVVAGPLATLTVSPNPASIGIGAAQQFTAVGRDASGNVVPVTATWSTVAGGGTIGASSGLFTAGTVPGTFTNTVVATSGGVSGSATVVVVAGALATITVSPDPATLGVGGTQSFTAVGRDASGNVIAITPTWTIVAGGGTVDPGSGVFTAGTVPGTYINTVQATSGGVAGFATVTVSSGALTSITVTPDPANLGVNAAQQFTATGRDAFGNVVAITPTWSVVAGGGAIDGNSGMFTAGTAPGTYTNTVRATSGGVSGSATVTVSAGALASITITPDPANLGIGATQQFTATGRDAFGNVVAITPTWSVVAGGGAINAASGVFTAGTVPGTFINTVRVTSGGVAGFATVNVVAGPLATITVTPDPATLGVGATRQFTAVGRDASGNVVALTPTWSVVAGGGSIGGTGLFTAGSLPGTYANTVQATSGAISGTATVHVVAGPLATITVTPDPANLAIGAAQSFTAVGRDALGNTVAITPTWSVVAGGGIVNGSGLFTAGTVPGTYANTVQATSGGVSGSATVNVVAGPLATITVSPDPASLGVGAAQQFTAVGRDASGNVVAITPTWSVVAGGGIVNGTGRFTAGTAPGTFTNTVQATSGGVSGFATVIVSAGALASITVTPNPASLAVTTSQQFTATGRDAFGNVVALTPTWSVVAGGGTDNGSGLFTAGTTPGTYANTVKATSGGISGFATVNVLAGPLASITITPDPANVGIGATQTFTAVGRDASGNVVAVVPTWSVVASGGTINSGSGLFTAGTVPGTFTNTVQATSGGVTGFATVTVSAGPLASIAITPDPANLGIGAAQQFTAVGRDASGNVVAITPTWSVEAGGGVIDSGSGLFTAGTLPGIYTNTVRATSGAISDFATVTVSAGALASITLTPDPANLGIGATQQFIATGKDAFGNVVGITPTWSVVASGGTVDSGSGLFTAGTVPGSFTNTVKATSGGISGFATVNVAAGALATLTVSPDPADLGIGATQTFTAVGRDASGNVVAVVPTWSVVAGGGTIDGGSGLFTAGTTPGTYTNTVVATSGGVTGTATVNLVAGELAAITVSPDPATLGVGATQQFTAVGRDASGNPVAITPTWSIVAGGGTMNGSGLFTAGTVPGTYINTVKATSGGVSGFATVTVVPGPLASITVTPDPADLGIGATQQFTATGKDAFGNVVALTPTWSVVAGGGTVDSGSGLFTAGTLPGTYANTVQATSGAVSGSATVSIVAGPLATITVSPNPASLGIGATRQFTAVGRDASGNVVPITPTWSVVADGGTIDGSSGLFTAGTLPGTYTNTVEATSGGVSGFATVNVFAGALASITVTPDPVGLAPTATQQFTATGRDASGNVVAITPVWSVVASGGTVNSGSGLFTAGSAPGTYTNTVRATSGGVSGFATVTVNAGALASITVTPNPATLASTASQQFTAIGRDAFGNVVAVSPTWSVVAGGGLIDGVGLFTAGTLPGTFTNTVQATNGAISGFATVNVIAGPLASITITPDPANLGIGATQTFTAVGRDASGNVIAITPTWSVAAGGGTINSGSGVFTAGTVPGTYANTVMATSGGISEFATVTVVAGPLASITVTPDPASLGIGAAQTFTAVGRDASGNVVAIAPTWSVAAGGGTIDGGSGLFTAGTTPGTYTNTVVATSGGVTGTATVTLVAGPLASITVTPNPANLVIGATQTFTAVGRDGSGNVVPITPTWSVVADGGTINSGSGLFTAGTVPGTFSNTVRATSGGISGSATVNVAAGPLATITVTPNPASLGVGGTRQFTAVGRDASGNVVPITPTWSVEAGGGTISGSGLFTAGTVPGTYTNTVQATSGGISGRATVTVVAGTLATITVTPDPASLVIGGTQQFTAVGRDASGNLVPITPTWSVIAGGGTIGNGSGLFTAGTVPGTYTHTVQASSGGITGFATVTVVAGPLATITVSPDPADLGIGATQTFTAVGRDASGNVVAVVPTWSVVAGGGTIDGGSGQFTAGTTPGTYANTVVATSGGITGAATVTLVAGPLASITLTPDPANLVIGAAQSFTAVGRDGSGNVVPITPTWSVVASGGTIESGSGLFTAGTVPGTYTNTVRATSGGISGFATVSVAAGPLATINVTPNPANVGVSGTRQFTAVGRDASGNVVAITPTWSVEASGGTINASSGLFTAGTVPGTFTNTVQATSGGISGRATVTVVAGALASVTVTPNPVSLVASTSQQFTATGRDAFGNVVPITPTWSVVAGGGSSNASGLFTAGTVPGTYTNTVQATSGGVSGLATVTVVAGPLASITITPDPADLGIGADQQFTATGKDAFGNVVAIAPTWSVVAGGGSVSGSGVFTAGTVPGTYTNTVQVTSGGISGFATVAIVAGPLATITVSPDPATLGVGGTRQFTAVGRDGSGNVVPITPVWSVVAGGGSVASGSGLFTAGTLPGTYTNTVQATSGGVSGFATVSVTAGALASITVTPNPVSLAVTTTQQFTATGRDAFGNLVAVTPTWSVVAGGGSIGGAGLFTAGTAPGTYTNTVRATSGGVAGFATVNVAAGPLATITVTPNPVTLGIGAAQTFTSVGRDAIGNVVAITPIWSVVAGGGTINSGSGLLTAGTVPGTYANTVQATSGGVSGFATVTVIAGPLASITITPDPANLVIGATQTFTAVGRDANGNVVAITPTWSVAAGGGTINSGSGLFTAGTVPGTYANTVVATSGGISEFATVTVVAGPLATITVSPNPADLGIGATQTFTAVGRDASGNVVTVAPTWSVVAGGGIIDGGSGLFTAGTTPGTFTNTVVATSGGITGAATVTLVAGPLASITITPNPANLVIGATQTFTAVGRDGSGNVVPITPTWSVVAGGGTVSSGSGLFTAGTVPGTYANTVRATSGGISGFATVNVAAGPLATITVTPNPATVGVAATRQFTAVGRDASGNVVPITPTWSVEAGGGTISGSGLFTAGTTPGTFTNTVQATSGGVSGRATVTVVAGALASITVTPNPASMAVTGTQTFSAVGRDAFGNVVPITPTWSVVSGGGTIDSGSGLFTAGTLPGTYTNTVQATSGGVSGLATVTVVAGPLASITVTPDPANLGIGAAQQFTATGMDASGNVVAIAPTWSVVAGGGSVSGSGVFTAGTVPGTYTNTVQATSGGVSGFATVAIVAGPLATITVSPDPTTLSVTGTRQFTAVGRDGSGNVIPITPTWSVVAGGGTINGSGLFTAGTAPGTYANTVQVTSDGVSGFATVTVTAGALASITVTPNPVTLAVATGQQFTATGADAFGNLVVITPTWSVVASGGTISGSGLFTAGTVPGTYTNTVRATSGGVSGFATVTVSAGALASITVTPNPVTLASTASQQFTATGRDEFGNVVAVSPTWSVVAGGGLIDGVGLFTAGTVPGTYTNTVQATSGAISGFATVNVIAGPLASITITPDPANLVIGAAQSFTAVGRDASGNVVPITPTWSVAAGGGTINSGSGVFTAGTVPGTYANTVVATSGGISEFATVTVVAGPLATITVSPDPADLGIGATQTFTAVGRDASGNVVAVAPTWSVVAGGGTIDGGSGLFTAGTLPGTYTNTVVATSGGVTGAATVTLVAGPLASITVTPNPANLVIGAAQSFTAVGRDGSGNVIPITPTWSVVAGGGTVDSGSGLFTAGTLPGTYANTVRATSGGISGFATVNLVAGPLATITVTPNPATVGVGATRQFTAVGRDASGNVIPITPTWSVVADGGTISGSGLFTAGTTPGTFTNTVQATSGGVSGRATVTVVAGALASITVTPNPVSMAVTGTQTFTAVGRDAFGNVVPITPTWSVVSGGGTIDSGSGLFTAGSVPGTYTNTVQATSGGVSGLATVTVVAGPLATITVSPDPANLGIGAAQQFTATGEDAFGNVVAITPTWSTVAGGGTINASGLFTAGTLPGTYTNTVQATSNGVSGFATVAIVAGPLATITVSPDPASLSVTGTQQFTAVGRDASGNVVAITPAWSVVAGGGTIDSGSGLFTAGTAPGTYTNTVVATSGAVSGSATVIVSAGALASITVTPNPVTLAVATGQQFAATGADAFGNLVAITPTWSVVAGGGSIGGAGLFTAGTVPGTYTNTVRATSGGVSGFATVVVTAGPLASITITPNPASLVTGATQQFTATGRDASGNVVAITPTWSTVAGGGTINSGSGLFTAGTVPGTYTNTVQATSGAISGFATVTVTVNLGAAASFALLGGSGASSCTGVSSVSGNVGVSPAGSISGFPAPCVILAPGDGIVHLNDPAAASAQAAVTAANGTLTGMARTADMTGQDLGGKTLAPGVYDFATSAQLTGTLTLDGPADGIWVFRTGTTLTTAADAKVTLAGGASAGNVYWQIGSSATLGATNDAFQGTIIADQSITLGSGTKLIGRAFARTGAVTMVTNLITLP